MIDKNFNILEFVFERAFYFSIGAICVYYVGVGLSITVILGWIYTMIISDFIKRKRRNNRKK